MIGCRWPGSKNARNPPFYNPSYFPIQRHDVSSVYCVFTIEHVFLGCGRAWEKSEKSKCLNIEVILIVKSVWENTKCI